MKNELKFLPQKHAILKNNKLSNKFKREDKVILAIGIISLVVFIFLALSVMQNNFVTKYDLSIQDKISKFRTEQGIAIFKDVTNILGLPLFAIIIISSIYFFYKAKKFTGIFLFSSAVAGMLLEYLISLAIARARPENLLAYASGFSFPSGHAVIATIFFLLLFIFLEFDLKTKLSVFYLASGTFVFIILAGFSRIYLNVHWLSDILGGISLGIFVVCICWFVLKNKRIKL